MKSELIKERIAKCEEKISKKENTIVKKTNLIGKKSDNLSKLGFPSDIEVEDLMKLRADGKISEDTYYEAYWIACDISSLEDDIKRARKEIEEIKGTIKKYESSLSGANEKERLLTTVIPESMISMGNDLVESWDKFDIARKNKLYKEYLEIGFDEFIKKHSYTTYDMFSKSNEEIHNENVKEAERMVLDLYNRIKDITGEVTSWDDLTVRGSAYGPVLNGVVIGKEGRARVESIHAGGYNIQRLHIRVLVHAF